MMQIEKLMRKKTVLKFKNFSKNLDGVANGEADV
jgi:hypothetical protein